MFNWGLHNSLAGNCTPPCVPGQSGQARHEDEGTAVVTPSITFNVFFDNILTSSGPPDEYAPNLEKIVEALLNAPGGGEGGEGEGPDVRVETLYSMPNPTHVPH